jgi:hypothetical protein
MVRISSGANRLARRIDLPLCFEGERVYAIWDCAKVGEFELLARIELDPRLLKKARGRASKNTFRYAGKLELPRPQDN